MLAVFVVPGQHELPEQGIFASQEATPNLLTAGIAFEDVIDHQANRTDSILANLCDDETATFRGGGVDLQNIAEDEHRGHIVLANEGGCLFLLPGHVEPPLPGFGVTETFVSKDWIALQLRRNEKAFDVWLPACHACQEKFNWCFDAPTIFRNEPFGENVERLSLLGQRVTPSSVPFKYTISRLRRFAA